MRYGFVLDQERCIGCHACTVACKEEHQVPVGVFRTWVKYIEKGAFPATSRHFGVMRCNHCDAAPCTEICPTVALFRRPDGIIDFDGQRCIGCKSCMQACPYDALYIDPNTNTAAKCNFCAHRVEANLEPACVIVCPTRAIIAGDLDDAQSPINRIVATKKVSVRKPQKGTEPKLFYVGIEGDLLQPTRLTRAESYMFAGGSRPESRQPAFDSSLTREVYDVAHPAPWGPRIAAYLWTKSIAAGVPLVAAMILALSTKIRGPLLTIVSPMVALVALAATAALLVLDLKRPDRFFYLLTKPNFRSWLVLGAYVLMAYGGATLAWLLAGIWGESIPGFLLLLTALLAAAAACYSAFLFAQAKGRDLWQSPMFFWHLLGHAFIAGLSVLLMLAIFAGEDPLAGAALRMLPVFLIISLLMVLAEVMIPHVSEDARLASHALVRGSLSRRFWVWTIGAGLLAPLAFAWFILSSGAPYTWGLAVAGLALAGVWSFQDVWLKAGQSVPLS